MALQNSEPLPESALAEFEEACAQETRDLMVQRLRVSLSVGLVLYGGFWVLDWLQHGEVEGFLTATLVIRLFIVALSLVTIYLTRKEFGRKHILPLSLNVLALATVGISTMTLYLNGFESDYYIGNMLVLFFVGLFMPWPLWASVFFCSVMSLSYFIPNTVKGFGAPNPGDYFSNAISPLLFLLGTCIYTCMATSMTDRLRRRDLALRFQLEDANRGLKRLDEAKTKFFSNVSHELRTPLMLILGPLEALLSGREKGNIKELLEAMSANAHRLLREVNMILNFSRLEAGRLVINPEPANLSSVLNELVKGARPYASDRGMKLEADGLDELPDMYFDVEKIETVAMNLLSNALKFTPDDGTITVRGFVTDEYAAFEVQDSGIGIPEEHVDKVFERFHQVDSQQKGKSQGTGLGLSFSKEIVDMHGGSMTLRSKLGEGTTFRVELPRKQETASLDDPSDDKGKTTVTKARAFADLSRNNLSEDQEGVSAPDDAPLVLLVEDNPDVRAFVKRSLASTYRIATAEDGIMGLVKTKQVSPDLIISDVMMPRMDGFEMVKKLREDPSSANIPIIMLTARTTVSDIVEGLNSGAIDYLTKPFKIAELEARVAAQLRASAMEKTLDERDTRLAAVGQMTSSLAHDLRGPLTTVVGRIGLIRMLASDQPGMADLDRDLQSAESAAKRAGEMIEEMVSYVRDGQVALSLEFTDMEEYIRNLGEDMRIGLNESDIELVVDVHPDEGLNAKIDREKIRRVVENLVHNSRDAFLHQEDRKESAQIHLAVKASLAAVSIRIADNGPGIPAEVADNLFQQFATAGKPQGTGLGLAIVRNLIKAHQGNVSVEFEPPEGGAAFVVNLPKDPSAEYQPA